MYICNIDLYLSICSSYMCGSSFPYIQHCDIYIYIYIHVYIYTCVYIYIHMHAYGIKIVYIYIYVFNMRV